MHPVWAEMQAVYPAWLAVTFAGEVTTGTTGAATMVLLAVPGADAVLAEADR